MAKHSRQDSEGTLRECIASITLEGWLFYCAFALCAFTTLMVRTTYPAVFGIPREVFEPVGYALSAILLIAKIVCDREATLRYGIAVLLVAVGVLSFWVAGAWRFSVLFLFIAAGKDVSLRVLACIVLVVQLSVLALTLPLALTGQLYSFTVWREVDGVWMPRYSYGYSHPNFLGQVFLTIALAFMVVRFPRFNVADAAVYLALGLAAALLVWARTATVCIVLVALLAFVSRFIVGSAARRRAAAGAALVAFCAAAGFSLAMMVCYSPDVPWMEALDQALSTRFSLAHRFFEVFGIEPFGRATMAIKMGDFVQESPDNVYALAFVKQGYVPALCLGALVLATYVDALRHARWDACILGLLVFAVVGIMEAYSTNFTLDFFLIGAAFTLYSCWPDRCAPPRGRGRP